MPLRREQDVVACRNHARSLAAGMSFSEHEQIRIGTAVSEIARNAFRYGQGGTAEFDIENAPSSAPSGTAQAFVCTIRDRGPGIPHLAEVLAGTYRSDSGMGKGIVGARRLMHRAEVETDHAGTVVRLVRYLPPGVRIEPAQVQAMAEALEKAPRVTPLDELSEQNRELIRTMDEIGEQREVMAQINEELTETNRGVVALYDELDTVYRVSRVVAAKLDLESLLKAITDATTDVCGAELGAFFHRQRAGGRLVRAAVSGPMATLLDGLPSVEIDELLGRDSACADAIRVDDLRAAHDGLDTLADKLPVRSYLAVAVCDSNGAVTGCLVFGHRAPGMFTERSERILASVALQASIGLENARLYRNVTSASAAKDQFLAMLSHELRTPLNPVFAVLASLEQDTTLSTEVRADLLVMRRNLQLEARLIDDLLDLTRIVQGKVPLQKEVVDVHAIIRLACETCLAAVVDNRVRVKLKLEAPRSYSMADAGRLQQVFWNLLNNAIKFTPAAGEIVIRTTDSDDRTLRVVICDTGRGIDPDALGKIFQPFEQGDSVIPVQFGGLGLGLAITRSIVDAHGGEIRAESEGIGHGATFIVSLPLTEAPPVRELPASPAQRLSPRAALNILLVDDHADTRTSLQRLLTRRGHTVTLAGSCQEALSQAATQTFDLVVSDLGLPDGSGHDLMRALVASHPGLPGIALSGYGMETDIERSHAAGFTIHLTKPMDFAVLEAAIEKTMASP